MTVFSMKNSLSIRNRKTFLTDSNLYKTHKTAWYQSIIYALALAISALFGSVFAFSSPVSAQTPSQNQVSINSEVYVLRTQVGADGKEATILKQPKDVLVIPGDKLRFILTYNNDTGQDVTGFRAVNPMPGAVQFVDVTEDWAEVSVDGGKTWGKLTALTVETKNDDNDLVVKRNASAEDVTHVRWVLNENIPANATGSVSFDGVVK